MAPSTSLRVLSSLLLGAVVGLACGDDSDGGDDEASRCRSIGEAICAEACACGDCSITMAGGGVSISFDDEAGCREVYVDLGCSQPDDTIDYDACESDLASPTCIDGADGSALDFPESCQSME